MERELTARCTVLESLTHGPELCLGAVLPSNPPQGGGPPITNWNWSQVSDFESHGGITWGEYTVVGTYADGAFTMTRPPVPCRAQGLEEAPEPQWESDLASPCTPPPGGWRVIDPERTTEDSLDETCEVARTLPGFADLWLDHLDPPVSDDDPADDASDDEDDGEDMNDPERLVLNVAVTGDLARAEARLRKTWGGALCVSRARHSARELRRIQHEVMDRPGVLIVGSGRDRVDVEVIYDDGSLQSALEERYPGGLVQITSALRTYVPA